MDYFKSYADLADKAEFLLSRSTENLYSIPRNQSKWLVFSVKTTIFALSNLVLTLNPITMDQLDNIQNCIFEFRGQRVMIDRDLADLYGVPTKVLNQAVKRNMRRFPEDFMFQLNDEEKQELVTFCDRLGVLKHSGVNPKAFTQEGVAMLSGILNSEVAIETNIAIMRAFVSARKMIVNMSVSHQIKKLSADIEFIKSEMEDTLEIQNDINESTRAQLDAISTALAELQAKPADVKPRRRIGFIQEEER